LILAAENGHIDCVRLLVDSSAENVKNNVRAFDFTCFRYNVTHIDFEFQPPFVVSFYQSGRTAMSRARAKGHSAIVDLLTANGTVIGDDDDDDDDADAAADDDEDDYDYYADADGDADDDDDDA
jgi:ankyrin repeat protein